MIDPGRATLRGRGAGHRHRTLERVRSRPATRADRPASRASDRARQAGAASRPKPQIFSRAQWGADERMRDKSSLHYGEVHAGFVHHTVNANGYTQRPGAGDPARHLRLPHAVPRLERHRLQLPGRPLRPDLGGPVRRRRPPGRRRAHARLQRLLLRDVGHRQLRDRPARRPRCSTPTAGCSPGSFPARRIGRVDHEPVRRRATSRRSTVTATRRQTACPGGTCTPSSRRSDLAATYQRSSGPTANSRRHGPTSCARQDQAASWYAPAAARGYRRDRPGWSADLVTPGRPERGRHADLVARTATTATSVYAGTPEARRDRHRRRSPTDQLIASATRRDRQTTWSPARPTKKLYLFPGTATAGFGPDACSADWSLPPTTGVGDFDRDGAPDLRSPRRRPAAPGACGTAGRPGRAGAGQHRVRGLRPASPAAATSPTTAIRTSSRRDPATQGYRRLHRRRQRWLGYFIGPFDHRRVYRRRLAAGSSPARRRADSSACAGGSLVAFPDSGRPHDRRPSTGHRRPLAQPGAQRRRLEPRRPRRRDHPVRTDRR